MKTSPFQTDLAAYTITLPRDPCLPTDMPKDKMDLAVHHVQAAALEEAYQRIEAGTGLTREQVTAIWSEVDGARVCTFAPVAAPTSWSHGPGISVVAK